MARRCELTGKAVQTGNSVSHANNKSRRRFLPNLSEVTLVSDALGQKVHLRITAHALRSVEHRGGIDAFLLKARDSELSLRARRLKKTIAKKVEAAAAAGGFVAFGSPIRRTLLRRAPGRRRGHVDAHAEKARKRRGPPPRDVASPRRAKVLRQHPRQPDV